MGRRKAKSVKDLHRHFAKRWYQRYPDIDMPNPDWVREQICKQSDNAEHLWTESKTRSHWEIRVSDTWVRVVYNKSLGSVVTVLPPLALREVN